jgi:enterochelin esterase-like enzyme
MQRLLVRRAARACAVAATVIAVSVVGVAQDSRPRRQRAAPPTNLEGSVKTASVPSKLLGRDVSYAVYLPKGYDLPENAKKKWPTLYFLHGLFEDHERWIGRGGAEMLDTAIKKGELVPVIAIVPNGGMSFFVDSVNGKQPYARFFFEEFVPHVDATYRTDPTRDRRVLMGSSMGGAGALRYAFVHGDLFAAVAAHSAAVMPRSVGDASDRAKRTLGFISQRFSDVFGDPLDEKAYRCANPLTVAEDVKIDPRLKIYFDCGEEDRYEFDDGARALHEVLTKIGVKHEMKIRPGTHGWDYLKDAMPDGLKFLNAALKCAPAPGTAGGGKAESSPAKGPAPGGPKKD